jgi:hypothetical protein
LQDAEDQICSPAAIGPSLRRALEEMSTVPELLQRTNTYHSRYLRPPRAQATERQFCVFVYFYFTIEQGRTPASPRASEGEHQVPTRARRCRHELRNLEPNLRWAIPKQRLQVRDPERTRRLERPPAPHLCIHLNAFELPCRRTARRSRVGVRRRGAFTDTRRRGR